ncbi:MAG: hypothetical protein ABEJ83_02665 [Candidatus Nanohaloarchaea archaeon]
MVDRGKVAVVSISLLFLIGGASALTFTVEQHVTEFYADAYGLSEDTTFADALDCNLVTSYAVPNCQPPITISIGGATVEEVKWSIANLAAIATDNSEQVTGMTEKRLNSSFGAAMAGAKAEAIRDLNDGVSEPVAVQNASDLVRGWYSQIQRNAINFRNRHALKIETAVSEVNKTSGVSLGEVFKMQQVTNINTETGSASFGWKGIQDFRMRTFNKTLFNGEVMKVYKPQVGIHRHVVNCNTNNAWDVTYHNITDLKQIQLKGGSCSGKETKTTDFQLKVEDPTGSRITLMDADNYVSALVSIDTMKDRAISNTRNVVEGIFQKYEPGELTLKEGLGPWEAMRHASTSYGDTGLYSYAVLNAEFLGYATNESYAFKDFQWSPEGVNETFTDTGQLFVPEGKFNNTIEAGKTYNVTERPYPWFTHTVNGEIQQETLNGTFTVDTLVNKNTGETVNETSVQPDEIYTSNTTDLANQIDQLEKDLEQVQSSGSGGAAGGGFSLGGFLSSPTGLGASVVLILLLLVGFLAAYAAGGATT